MDSEANELAQTADPLAWAKRLIAAGVPVFVAQPAYVLDEDDGKLVRDWHGGSEGSGYRFPGGWNRTPCDERTLRRWTPECALGAVGGHTFDFGDTDTQNNGQAARTGLPMPTVYFTVRTPSGGTHEAVAALGVGSRDGFVPGVDFKGGDAEVGATGNTSRGFVFIEPTPKVSKTTGEIGVTYTLVEDSGLAEMEKTAAETGVSVRELVSQDTSGQALAEIVRAAKAPKAVGEFVAVARGGERPVYNAFAGGSESKDNRRTKAEALHMVRANLQQIRDCAGKDGNHTRCLNNAGLVLGHWVGELFSRDAAEQYIGDALKDWAARTGYTGQLVLDGTARGSKWGASKGLDDGMAEPMWVVEPGNAVPVLVDVEVDPETGEASVPDLPADEAAAEEFSAIDWHELWVEPEDEEWIVEGLVPARRATALYSAPKLGKSLLMLEMAVQVSRGNDFLGMTTEKTTVLYVDHENDPRGDVRSRLRSMGVGPDDLQNLKYLSFPPMASLDTAAGGQALLRAVKRFGAGLVVIDTVSRTIDGEENSNDTWLQFYKHTGKHLKSAGLAYVRLDHSGKDESKGQRGGSAKSGDVDAIWQLIGDGKRFELRLDGGRMQFPDDVIRFARETEPNLRSVRTTVLRPAAGDGKFVADPGGRLTIARRMVAALYSNPGGMTKTAVIASGKCRTSAGADVLDKLLLAKCVTATERLDRSGVVNAYSYSSDLWSPYPEMSDLVAIS